MIVRFLIDESGSASSWSSIADHHKLHRIAKRMVEDELIARFVDSIELPSLYFDDEKNPKMESRTYFTLNNQWVTKSELESLKKAGLNASVKNIEVFGSSAVEILDRALVRNVFIGWNLILAAVLLRLAGLI